MSFFFHMHVNVLRLQINVKLKKIDFQQLLCMLQPKSILKKIVPLTRASFFHVLCIPSMEYFLVTYLARLLILSFFV